MVWVTSPGGREHSIGPVSGVISIWVVVVFGWHSLSFSFVVEWLAARNSASPPYKTRIAAGGLEEVVCGAVDLVTFVGF